MSIRINIQIDSNSLSQTSFRKRRLLDQRNFIKKDLKKANRNRDAVPWIIVAAHHPLYCSNTNHDNACFKPMPYKNGTLDGDRVGIRDSPTTDYQLQGNGR